MDFSKVQTIISCPWLGFWMKYNTAVGDILYDKNRSIHLMERVRFVDQDTRTLSLSIR